MMLVHEHATLEEASSRLLLYVLEARHWRAAHGRDSVLPALQPPEHHARVGKLRICACVTVERDLLVHLHVAFRAPGLTPARAADHLESFLKDRMPLQPNTEWTVEVDGRHWIRFERVYVRQRLVA